MKKLNTEDTADYSRGPRVLSQLCILIFQFFTCEIILSVHT